jgi:predicted nucleotidyltransferase
MDKDSFDPQKAKEFLTNREKQESEKQEQERLKILQKATECIKREFQNTQVEVFLVGSVIKPYSFHPKSDVDIVLKNFSGDRFEIWTKMEAEIGRTVEIIRFENCHFQDFVLKEGLKVV